MILKDCLEIIIDNRGRNPKYYDNEAYPVIDNVMIKNNYHPNIKEATRFINQDTHDNFLRGYLEPNIPIMTLVGGGIGNVSLAIDDKSVIVQNTIGFKTKAEILDSVYLYYWFLYKHDELIQFNRGSGQPSIRKTDIENMNIELKNINYQRKVSKILSKIDEKIALNNEINNNLFEVVLNDFNDFLDKNTYSEMVKLEDCIEKINTGADAIQRAPIVDYDTGIRCIRIGDMTNGRDYHSWGFTKMTDKDFENYKLIRNDIVITRTAVNGLTYMITDEENTVCNNGNIRLRVNNKYNPLYIYLNTKTKDFRNYIDRINSETSVRPNMKVEYFTSYEIKKIDLEKQNDFCNRAESIMKKIQNNKVENYNLEQLRDTLLPKLMNGEVDLDNIEI